MLDNFLLSCSDREKPIFRACPRREYVQHLAIVQLVPPRVTDNSGAIANLSVNYHLLRPVKEDVNITWTATDHAGNEADPCIAQIHVTGM